MSLITPDFGLIFWMVVIIGLVFLILAKVGFPIITGMVRKRTEHIEGSLKAADQAREALSSIEQSSAQMIEQTRAQQAEILSDAAKTREQIISQARADAQQEADKVAAQARERLAAERENALRDINSQIATLSVEVAGKLLREKLSDDKTQNELIDKLVAEVAAAPLN